MMTYIDLVALIKELPLSDEEKLIHLIDIYNDCCGFSDGVRIDKEGLLKKFRDNQKNTPERV